MNYVTDPAITPALISAAPVDLGVYKQRRARLVDGECIETTQTARLILTLDYNLIVRWLGYRAMRSKSGKARFLHGAIVVTAETINEET